MDSIAIWRKTEQNEDRDLATKHGKTQRKVANKKHQNRRSQRNMAEFEDSIIMLLVIVLIIGLKRKENYLILKLK